jgi:hypothetical protein
LAPFLSSNFFRARARIPRRSILLAHLVVHLTDIADWADEANIDVQAVEITLDGTFENVASSNPGSSVDWALLNIKGSIHHKLLLRNGVITKLAEGDKPGGQINEMRLVLGNRNSIVIGGNS